MEGSEGDRDVKNRLGLSGRRWGWNDVREQHWSVYVQFSPVQSLSQVQLCNPMNHSTPGFPVHHQLPESAQTHVRQVGDAIQPPHPLLSPSPPAFNLSRHQGLFQWVRSSHQMPKYWSLSFSISPSNEYLGLISFRMDWFELLAVQGAVKSLLQHHGSKAPIFGAQLSLWSNPHIHTRLLEKPQLWLEGLCHLYS